MPPLRWFALAWTLALLTAVTAVSFGGGGPLDRAPEVLHLVGHLVLFGTLAHVLARAGARPSVAIALAIAAGVAVEGVQMLGAHRAMLGEAAFDTVVDALSAMFGAAVAAPDATATALGGWLHPALVVPVGLIGAIYAVDRDTGRAFGWAAVGTLTFVPAGVLWLIGVRRGWFATADLVDRRARPPLFAFGCLCAAAFVSLAVTDPGARLAASALLALALTLTVVTTAGFKLSGHVATALTLAVVCVPASSRGPGLFLACAALLTWARVRAGVHRPAEVAGAWAFAAALLVGRDLACA